MGTGTTGHLSIQRRFQGLGLSLLGGSWDLVSRVISTLIRVISR